MYAKQGHPVLFDSSRSHQPCQCRSMEAGHHRCLPPTASASHQWPAVQSSVEAGVRGVYQPHYQHHQHHHYPSGNRNRVMSMSTSADRKHIRYDQWQGHQHHQYSQSWTDTPGWSALNPNDFGQINNDPRLIMNTIKTEDSSPPATEALDYLLENEGNVLLDDLQELIRRDPTLSSLKTESDYLLSTESNSNSGMPIPNASNMKKPSAMNSQNTFATNDQITMGSLGLGDFEDALSEPPTTAGSSFGASAFAPSSSSGSNIGSSPSMFSSSSIKQSSAGTSQPLFTSSSMDTSISLTNDSTLAALNGGDDSNSLMKLDLNELGDVDINDYFTNDASKNVSFGMTVKQEAPSHPTSQPQPMQTSSSNFWQTDPDNLFFGSTSFSSQTGGVVSASSKDLLSSSVPTTMFPSSPLGDILSDFNSSPKNPQVPSPSHSPNQPSNAGPERHSTLHKLLLRRDPVSRPSPVRSPENRKTLEKLKSSLSASNPLLCQQLSKSAPTRDQGLLDKMMWSRREPRQHISSVCSVGNESSIIDEVNEVLSGTSPNELPDIESDDEDEDLSQEAQDSSQEDFSDDEEGGIRPRTLSNASSTTNKKEKHFWQYNVQAKGPKGQKIVVETKIEDPHQLNEIVDPVFSGDVQLQGIKHSGKARRGDGNDLTANPKKLAAIGKELEQLNKYISDLTPVSEMPFNSRCKSRKEKNKLASRACRLKKKAQHEANKLKCHGLEEEHHDLLQAIARAKEILVAKVDQNSSVDHASLTNEVDNSVKKALKNKVAGVTTDYVNRQISKFMNNS